MIDPGEPFGADQLHGAEIDGRLVAELEPSGTERVEQAHAQTRSLAGVDSGLAENRGYHVDPERLLQDRQHAERMPLADALDILQQRQVPSAHQLDDAGILHLTQAADDLDGIRALERD